MAAALAGWLAGGVWGQGAAATGPARGVGTSHRWWMAVGDDRPDPVPELALDEATVAKANDRGAAILKGVKWQVPVDSALDGRILDAGDRVVWSGFGGGRAVEKATGKQSPIQEARKEFFSDREEVLITPQQLFSGPRGQFMWAGDGPQGSVSAYDVWAVLKVRAYLRATGAEQWSYTLPAKTYATRPMTFADGILYVVTKPFDWPSSVNPREPSTLIGLNGADGKELFVNPLKEVLSAVAVKDGELLASSSSGEVVGFDAKTGKEKWRQRIWMTEKPRKVVLTRQTAPDEAPAFSGDVMVVPVSGMPSDAPGVAPWEEFPGLAAFDVKMHKQLWFFRPPDFRLIRLEGVQVNQGEIVATGVLGKTCNGSYVGVNVKTGQLNWQFFAGDREEDRLGITLPLVSDGVMYLVREEKLMAVPLAGEI